MFVKTCSNGVCSSSNSPDGNLRLFLTDPFNHSFFLHGFFNSSKYDGFYFEHEGELFKAFDLNFNMNTHSNLLLSSQSSAYISNKKFGVSFSLDNNSLAVRSSVPIFFSFDFDFRRPNDFSIDNRFYSVKPVIHNGKNFIVVSFSDRKYDVPFFAVIYSPTFSSLDFGSWVERQYDYDAMRNSESRRFVFNALSLFTDNLSVSVGEDLNSLFVRASSDFNFNYASSYSDSSNLVYLARSYALSSLESLLFSDKLLAGFPWFSEEWFRDELISLEPLLSEKCDLCKGILFSILNFFYEHDTFSNTSSKLLSADAFGLLALRFKQLISIKPLSSEELSTIRRKFLSVMDRIVSRSFDERIALFYSGPHETWMDSLDRSGFRVEIQALMLQALDFAFYLSKDEKYKVLYNRVLSSVRSNLVVNNILIDGLTSDFLRDLTVRPNVFLAYYFFPNLVDASVWRVTFDSAIRHLWLDWGGFSTVDNSIAVPFDTGEHPKSYHNGNSWFFVNNIAAMSLLSVSKDYLPYAEKILHASISDNLFSGAVGSCSETSSNKVRTSSGSLIQSWSNASLILLIDKFRSFEI